MINYYRCPCGHTWHDLWECACNDTCPECGEREIEPTYSTESDKGYSALIFIVEDVEHDVYLIREDSYNEEKVRQWFSRQLSGYGFRPIKLDEFLMDYWNDFKVYIDYCEDHEEEEIQEKYPNCDPSKVEWMDKYVKWVDIADVV